MLKVMTIIGTRPELIKLSRLISELDKNTNHILVHTGQNYDFELNKIFFKEMKIRIPNYYLNAISNSTAGTIGKIIQKTDEVIDKEKPDAVVLYGDTNSCLSVISVKKRKIPIFHLEAGNRCFDQRVPEEINRKIVDHLSDINLVLTEHSRRYLISEGIRPDTIFKTGSNMREVLNYYSKKINNSKILKSLKLSKNKFFLVSIHREENVDSKNNLLHMADSINAIADKFNLPIIISTHPRTKMRIESFKKLSFHPKIKFCKPFGFLDYIKLQLSAKCIISDSGTITEESSMLNLPSITIRNSHERPEGMDFGTLIMSGLRRERVLDSIDIILKTHNSTQRVFKPITDYENVNTSKQILRIIFSYTDFVQRNTWKKDV